MSELQLAIMGAAALGWLYFGVIYLVRWVPAPFNQTSTSLTLLRWSLVSLCGGFYTHLGALICLHFLKRAPDFDGTSVPTVTWWGWGTSAAFAVALSYAFVEWIRRGHQESDALRDLAYAFGALLVGSAACVAIVTTKA